VKSILEHAEPADFEFLVKVMRSPLHLGTTEAIYERLERYRQDPSARNQLDLIAVLESEIRYAGSADLAYAARLISGRSAGVTIDVIVHDVAKRLKVKVPAIGPVDAKLESLAEGVMAKELFKLSPEEQRELIRSQGLGPKATNEAVLRIQRHGPVAIVPVLLVVLGREAVEQLIIRLVTRAIGGLIGREAARQLIANLAVRFPWWTQWVGPVVWGATGAWAVLDIQGPAYRKTIPAVLYVSLIALRTSGARKKARKHKVKDSGDTPADHEVLAEGVVEAEADAGAGVEPAARVGEGADAGPDAAQEAEAKPPPAAAVADEEGGAADEEGKAADEDDKAADEDDRGKARAASPKAGSKRSEPDDA
jgi:uncharacterized protein YaaW (UPF0174 family)